MKRRRSEMREMVKKRKRGSGRRRETEGKGDGG